MSDKAKKIVVMYSGGLDSFALLFVAKQQNPEAEIVCVYWDHEHGASVAERNSLPDFVEVRHCEWMSRVQGYHAIKGNPNGAIYIPGRNLVFAVLTACQYLPDEIWLGALYEENNSSNTDKNDKFIKDTTSLLQYVLKDFSPSVTLRTPLVELQLTKRGVVKHLIDNGCPVSEITATMSCYQQEDPFEKIPCGSCLQCLKRWAVFGSLGFSETCRTHPLDSPKNILWLRRHVDKLNETQWKDRFCLNNFWWPYLNDYMKENPEKFKSEDWNYIRKSMVENLDESLML